MKRLLCVLLLSALSLAAQESPAPAGKPLPLHLGIVLHASKNTFGQQQAAAVALIQQLVRPGVDEAFIVVSGGDKPWPRQRIDWDNKPDSLIGFVKSLDKMESLPDAFRYEMNNTSFGGDSRMADEVYSYSPLNVFNISAEVMKSDPNPGRRVLIMFRDPWNHSPGFSSRYSRVVEHNHNEVIESVKRAEMSVYVIGIEEPLSRPKTPAGMNEIYGTLPGQNGGTARNWDQEMERAMDQAQNAGRHNVERLTKETGGMVVFSRKKNYTDAVPAIVQKLSSPDLTATGK